MIFNMNFVKLFQHTSFLCKNDMLKSNYLKHKVNYEVDKSVCQHLRIIHVLQHYFTINGRW